MHGTFFQVALLLLVCALVGALFVRLRQPVLIAYIVVGIAAGPAVFGFVEASDAIDLLAQIGVAVLLFLVGLKLDLKHIRHIGPVALATGLGQLAFTICIGFVLTLALGKGWVEALYVAVALTFSSTIIIVKLLSDKRELDSLHGRIAVGFLIVQDLAVVLAMMAMSALREPAADSFAAGLGAWYVPVSLVLRLLAAGLLIFVLMRWVLPRVVAAMARSQELLGLFAISWGIALAACGEWAGFSKEAGAFLAGFSLASTPFREALGARLSGIRDFLLLFFFIDLGAKLELGSLGAELWPALVLSLFVLIGNPLIVMVIMGVMGYRRRTGFMAGLTVAQISEFSIVFVAMGITLGHVGGSALGLTTLVGLITITLSTYMILYAQPMYERLAPALRVFERRHPFREPNDVAGGGLGTPAEEGAQVLLFGVGRHGARMLRKLQQAGLSVAGVDFDPDNVAMLRGSGLKIYFGDSEDPDFLDTLPLAQVQWAISALPLADASRSWLHALRAAGYVGRVGVVVRDAQHARALRHENVDWVLNPFEAAADHAAQALALKLHAPEAGPCGPQAGSAMGPTAARPAP